MENAVHTKQIGSHTVKVFFDPDPLNPCTEFEMFGKMICSHRRYNLGHEQFRADDFETWDEVYNWLKDERGAAVILPLILYDHSGLSISTRREYPFNCQWDAGQVGYIYATAKQVADEFGGDIEKAKDCLVSEVSTYDYYLTGQVFGYVVENEEGEVLDSCWGFYGSDYALNEGKAQAQFYEEAAQSGEKFAASFMCC